MAKPKEIDIALESFKNIINNGLDVSFDVSDSKEVLYAHTLLLLGIIGNLQQARLNKIIQGSGLSQTAVHVLGIITRANAIDEKIYSKDLEDKLHVSNPTMSGVLKRLEQKGLIYRKSDIEDARSKAIYLTEEGKKVKNYADEYVDKFKKEYFGNFNDNEINQLHELLMKLLNNLIE